MILAKMTFKRNQFELKIICLYKIYIPGRLVCGDILTGQESSFKLSSLVSFITNLKIILRLKKSEQHKNFIS